MSSIDERVVKMVFDNDTFKRKAAETKQSLADVNRAVDTAGKSKGLLDLSAGMQRVGLTASKMAVITTTALATIANKATNTALSLASSLTLDPIKQGFAEYESLLTKQNVIMNATGKSADEVKSILNELNEYSDKTIYSFGNMTDAITKFVNAGVPLDRAVVSIKGIANAAAFAGASSEEANRAMYAFSQSMSLGFIGLQDWMQIENANLGTIRFKNELLNAAVAAGTLTKRGDEFITKTGKAVSATKGWRDGLQEQWATTEVLNKALGQYANENTKLGKKAFKAAQDVRTFSAFMETLKESLGSGWSQIFTTLIGGLDESTSFWTGLSNTIGKNVHEMFSWINATAKTFKAMGGFQNLLQGIQNLLAPFGAILEVIGAAWRAAFPTSGEGSGEALAGLASGFAKITAPLQKVADLILLLTPVMTALFSGIRAGSITLGTFLGYLSDLASKLLDIQAPDGGGFLAGLFEGIKDKAFDLGSFGVDAAKTFFGGLIQGLTTLDFDTTGTIIGAGLLGGIFLALRKIVSGNFAIDLTGGLVEGIKDTFGQLGDTLGALQAQVQSKTLMQIATAVGLLTASVVALSFVDAGKLTKALTALSVGFGQLLVSMAILTKISGSAGFVQVPLIAASMVLLASSVFLLTGAIALMSLLSWDQIGKGLAGVGGALVVIAGGMKVMPKSLPLTAAGLILVGVALNAIATSIAIMGNLEWGTIGKGLTTTAGALVAIALGMQLMPLTLPFTAAGLVLVAIALNGIASAVKIMGSMTWDKIGKGLATLGGALAILSVGLAVMSGTLLGSAALIVAAGAIAVITPALLLMSKLSWEEIGKGLVTLAGGLAILAIAMYAMSGALLGAAALLIVAPALLALSTALVALGQLSWDQLLVALVGLAAGLTVIGVAGLLLGPVIPALLGLGVALLLLGGGLALAGAGIFLFTSGLAILVGLGAAAFSYISDAVEAFVAILPKLGEGFANFLVSMAKAIAAQAPIIAKAFVKLMTEFINATIKILPKLVELFNAAMDALIQVAIKSAPKLAKSGVQLLTKFINTIADNLGGVIKAGANLIIAWIEGITNEAPRIARAAADAVIKFIRDMGAAIEDKGPELQGAMAGLGISMIKGLIGGIGAMFGQATSAIGELAQGVINKAKSILKIFSPSRVFNSIGRFLVQGLTDGIQNNAVSAITAVASMVSGQIAVASEYISQYLQKLDQQTIAAQAKADGLALAAAKAQKAADKTKTKSDDRAADRLSAAAAKAQREADRAEARVEAAKAAAERREQYNEASTIDKAKMRSEDAETALDKAKELERRAEAARVAAAALDRQSRARGLTDKERRDLRKQADELEARARSLAAQSNAQIEAARKAAADSLALQKLAGDEAAKLFQEQFNLEARTAAEEEAFAKLSNAEKAAQRRAEAEALKLKAEADLERAKQLAYSDLEAANALAQVAMDEAEKARDYLKEALSYEQGASGPVAGGGATGTVVDLAPSEAAAIAFNNFSSQFDAATAAASAGRTIEFNQYNTSPEALSPTEIYRNTNNQLTFAAEKLDEAA